MTVLWVWLCAYLTNAWRAAVRCARRAAHPFLRKWRRSRENLPDFTTRLNHPRPDTDFYDLNRGMEGWISSQARVVSVALKTDPFEELNVPLVPRPDVKLVMGGRYRHHIGFESLRTMAEWGGDGSVDRVHLSVRTADGRAYETDLAIPAYRERKLKKRQRILPLVVCPACKGELERLPNALHCAACRTAYAIEGNALDFLTEDMRRAYEIVEAEEISDWDYDEEVFELMRSRPNGFFLDCGAGLRRTFHPDIVNFEITDYASTDVLGVAEHLPFRDAAFDGVICVAVLEHVKDPFQVARELQRVLKPGGFMYCAVPFLQPLHAFPHHYYNMTQDGLCNLFQGLQIERKWVPLSLHPMTAIKWILRRYYEGLPWSQQVRFMGMTMRDVMDLPDFQQWARRRFKVRENPTNLEQRDAQQRHLTAWIPQKVALGFRPRISPRGANSLRLSQTVVPVVRHPLTMDGAGGIFQNCREGNENAPISGAYYLARLVFGARGGVAAGLFLQSHIGGCQGVCFLVRRPNASHWGAYSPLGHPEARFYF
jgi:SAM-dependent methyltransferase